MADVLRIEQAVELIAGEGSTGDGIRDAILSKLARGGGLALYRNDDLGHPMLGDVVAFTYGHSEAQFETAEPPAICPDGLMVGRTGGINWRYQLIGVVPPLEQS